MHNFDKFVDLTEYPTLEHKQKLYRMGRHDAACKKVYIEDGVLRSNFLIWVEDAFASMVVDFRSNAIAQVQLLKGDYESAVAMIKDAQSQLALPDPAGLSYQDQFLAAQKRSAASAQIGTHMGAIAGTKAAIVTAVRDLKCSVAKRALIVDAWRQVYSDGVLDAGVEIPDKPVPCAGRVKPIDVDSLADGVLEQSKASPLDVLTGELASFPALLEQPTAQKGGDRIGL